MQTQAVILNGPGALSLGTADLTDPLEGSVVVRIDHSGISTGTERLFWRGTMPAFPGMGYPLVPGYESTGEVVEAAPATGFRPGDHVFVPGAACYSGLRGLFGGAARVVHTPAGRLTRIDPALDTTAPLMALAATARHAIAGLDTRMPDLIVGHGVLGRLLARLTLAAGGPPPTVWETCEDRRDGARGYAVVDPDADDRRDYRAIYDASGAEGILDTLIGRLAKGGEIVLAGFYETPVAFAFPPAFMREARLRVAAEWQPDDMLAVRMLVEAGDLSLDGLVTHVRPVAEAEAAYASAFTDPRNLKTVLDWKGTA
jgi:3-hydroxyethyl bacteriochlorophyllide a dehydrogenase